jgi:hypothetical protein
MADEYQQVIFGYRVKDPKRILPYLNQKYTHWISDFSTEETVMVEEKHWDRRRRRMSKTDRRIMIHLQYYNIPSDKNISSRLIFPSATLFRVPFVPVFFSALQQTSQYFCVRIQAVFSC